MTQHHSPVKLREPLPLVAVLLTFNEEDNLRRCLPSLQALGCPIVIVDSGSSDGTREYAQRFGVHWLEHAFVNHTSQWEWAMQNLPFRCEWVLALDADQYLLPELASEILAALPQTRPGGALASVNGFYLNRRHIFRGRWVRHGALYPKYLLKLFRPESVYFDAKDLVDHHFHVRGATAKMRHDIVEQNGKENRIQFWIDKHNRYARSMAREQLLRTREAAEALHPRLWGNPDERILWLKLKWYALPLYWRPFLYFFYRYIFRLGFLDGKQGFVFHFLQAWWFRTLVDINFDELRDGATPSSPPEASA